MHPDRPITGLVLDVEKGCNYVHFQAERLKSAVARLFEPAGTSRININYEKVALTPGYLMSRSVSVRGLK